MFRVFLSLIAILFSMNSFATNTPVELFAAINSRLSYMEDVALHKANNHQPIEDIEREIVVIENASLSAAEVGLERESIMKFFRAQISVAKAIQYRYRADLLSQPTTQTPRNLDTVVRPALILLGEEINNQLAQYLRGGGSFSEEEFKIFDTALTNRYLTKSDKQMLFKPLTEIRLR